MTFKEVVFNIIIPLISGIIGGTISANIIVRKNIKKNRQSQEAGDNSTQIQIGGNSRYGK